MKQMTYEEFREYVVENIVNYLPAKYKDWEAEAHVVAKTNQVLDAVCLRKKENFRGITAPIYVQPAYEEYDAGMTLELIMQRLVFKWMADMERFNMEGFEVGDYLETLKKNTDRVIFRLVNRERNAKMLERVPHRAYLAQEIVYYMITEVLGDTGEILITHSNAKMLGLTEEELFEHALKNTISQKRIVLENITDVICELIQKDSNYELSKEDAMCIYETMCMDAHKRNMWIFSNKDRHYGAHALLYPERLKNLADSIADDLYVLTSSVHELVVLSVKEVCLDEIKKLLYELSHDECTPKEEYLAENIYKYCRHSNTLIQVA